MSCYDIWWNFLTRLSRFEDQMTRKSSRKRAKILSNNCEMTSSRLIKEDLTFVDLKSMSSLARSILQFSSLMSKSLKDLIYLSDYFHIKKFEFSDKLCMRFNIDLFLACKTKLTCSFARSFIISFIAFSIAMTRKVMIETKRFIACIWK